jgi:hypothetical protein
MLPDRLNIPFGKITGSRARAPVNKLLDHNKWDSSLKELTMDVWTSQSNPGKQTMLSVACAVVGLVLAIGFRNFSGFGTNVMAGFFLGVLLLLIGVVGFLVSGKQTVVIDPKARHISIEESNRFGTKKRIILFNEPGPLRQTVGI